MIFPVTEHVTKTDRHTTAYLACGADDAPLIVFVTAFDEHAVRAFDLDAVDYLLKPYDKDRLLKALHRVRNARG